jgi:hypothetical protein
MILNFYELKNSKHQKGQQQNTTEMVGKLV